MIITPEQEKVILETFKSIYSTKQEVKELNAGNANLLQGLSESLQIDKADIVDSYRLWAKIVQNKKGDLGNVGIIVSSIIGE